MRKGCFGCKHCWVDVERDQNIWCCGHPEARYRNMSNEEAEAGSHCGLKLKEERFPRIPKIPKVVLFNVAVNKALKGNFGLCEMNSFEPYQTTCICVCKDEKILLDFCKEKGYNLEGGTWAKYYIKEFK